MGVNIIKDSKGKDHLVYSKDISKSDALLSDNIDGYEILQVLGEGGGGYVAKAKYCQYISLLSNKKNWNNSVEKRANHTNRNNLNNKTVNEDRFAITYKRFIEKDRKRKEKVSKMKKIKEEQENKIYSHKPVIDKNSRKISSKNNEDFFSRQKRLLEKKEKKNDMIKRRIKENENVQIKTNKSCK